MPQPNREFELKLDLTGEELRQLARQSEAEVCRCVSAKDA